MNAALGAVLVVLLFLLACVQLASDAILARAATPDSLPAHIPSSLGVRVYAQIERVAPAPYVESMLARAAYDRGDLAQARRYALRLPISSRRDELLAQMAQARGDQRLGVEYFLLADDVFSIGSEVDRLASKDPGAAYALELQMKARLARSATHPDALADAYWRLGQLATLLGRGDSQRRAAWLRTGMLDYEEALSIAPLSGKYLLAAGVQALDLQEPKTAARYFQRAIDANPANADAYAGLGLAALRLGRPADARADAERGRSYDPRSPMLRTLDAQLR